MSPKQETLALAETVPARVPAPTEANGIALVVQRLAENPQVDIAKLEKIIELQERILAHEAKSAFDAAFSEMQGELPTIIERAKTDKAKYAPLEDIVGAVRPILCRHRFGLSHRTEWLEGGKVRIVGVLTHAQGHEKTSVFESSPDTSGSKNGIQSLGSTMAYGRRYTTKDLLNIVTKGEDDDGETAGRRRAEAPDEPAGFADWADNMTSVCDEGTAAMVAAWKASPEPLTTYAQKYRQSLTAGWKARAKAADKAVSRG